LNPAKQVEITFKPTSENHKGEEFGELHIDISGLWAETILYEVPILFIVSQAYYCTVDTKWDYVGQEGSDIFLSLFRKKKAVGVDFNRALLLLIAALARQKAERLLSNSVVFSEFGTRRRRSYKNQEIVIRGLVKAGKELGGKEGNGKLAGTSNVNSHLGPLCKAMFNLLMLRFFQRSTLLTSLVLHRLGLLRTSGSWAWRR
jgi:nicotinate phosphoribosyltransferase